MSELIQEFVSSNSQRLRVDRDAGVIRGVKLLGLASRNGRRYRERALVDAIGLYEGAKVNINHPKGHPLAPRDYQDRLGMVRGVEFRAGEGLFGDLHFNPQHPLSEQLVWDAENAPQNLGMSHNVLARTKQAGDETFVEAITKVQSIDLVADPATTSGLYEHAVSQELKDESQEPEDGRPRLALDSQHVTRDSITLEQLRKLQPGLVDELVHKYETQISQLRAQLEAAATKEAATRRREFVLEVLQENELPLPTADGKFDSLLTTPQFIESLLNAADEATVRAMVEERAEVIKLAHRLANWAAANNGRPKAKSQHAVGPATNSAPIRTAADFAAVVRG